MFTNQMANPPMDLLFCLPNCLIFVLLPLLFSRRVNMFGVILENSFNQECIQIFAKYSCPANTATTSPLMENSALSPFHCEFFPFIYFSRGIVSESHGAALMSKLNKNSL